MVPPGACEGASEPRTKDSYHPSPGDLKLWPVCSSASCLPAAIQVPGGGQVLSVRTQGGDSAGPWHLFMFSLRHTLDMEG